MGKGSEDTPRVTGPGELLSLSLWSRGLRVEQLVEGGEDEIVEM